MRAECDASWLRVPSLPPRCLCLSCQGIMMVMVLMRLFADDGVGEIVDVIMFVAC